MSGYPQAIAALPPRVRSRAGVKLSATLLLPSFGVVVFAVTLIEVLFLANGAQGLFRDSDTGWHIRNGEAILQSRTLPKVDHFSYTRAGEPWLAWEWLSDVVLGGANRVAGLPGVAWVAAFSIGIAAWGVARLSFSLGGNLFLTAASVIALLGTTSIHWLARPHIFSWLFALAFLAVAEHERRGRSRALYTLPVLACLWANMHGSFLLGPGILLIYMIGDWLLRASRVKAGVREFLPGPPSAGALRQPSPGGRGLSRFSLAALLSLLATFINPYGWRLHEHVFTYLQNDYLMDHISEFRSFSFHSPGAYNVEAFLFIAIVGIIALVRQRAFGPALLGIGMLHISLYSARHFPTAAVLLLPLAVPALTREAREWDWLRPLLDYSDRLRAIDRRVLGIVPLAVVLVLAVVGMKTLANAGSVTFNPAVFPVRAADFMERNNVHGRVFSKDQWGGYLIYRFDGRVKVFMDGRSDFYGQQLIETYAQVADVKPAWNVVLKQYDVGLVLIPSDDALAAALQLSPGWRRIYSDSVAAIFERLG